jgi:hypothetical protein
VLVLSAVNAYENPVMLQTSFTGLSFWMMWNLSQIGIGVLVKRCAWNSRR